MNSAIRTHTGRLVDLANPAVAQIDMRDIAHALANINRFTGHTSRPYSVAEHCVRGSYVIAPRLALEFLLHDATEAYVGDVSKPLKSLIGEVYASLEARWADAIATRYTLNTSPDALSAVKFVDFSMLRAEMIAFMSDGAFGAPCFEEWDNPGTFQLDSDRARVIAQPMSSPREAYLLRVGELIAERFNRKEVEAGR
jgi:hypothetical protein